MRTQDNKQEGFSLLEALIVMSVIVAMTAAVIPNINTSIQNYRLSASAQEIASQVQSARLRAVRGNAMCTFLITASGRRFGIDVDGDGNISSTADVALGLNTNVNFVESGHATHHQRRNPQQRHEDGNRVHPSRYPNRCRFERAS